MPRPLRHFSVGGIYHVLNRGNGQADLFLKEEDFRAFVGVLSEGLERYRVDLLDWCLMSNHWHLVLRPRARSGISDLMRWIGVTHVRRHHEHYHTRGGGHLYQGRFKSFPVQDDRHFLTLCQYVEANPRRAGMVKRAEKWPWSRLGFKPTPELDLPIADWPVTRPKDWLDRVNQPLPEKDLATLRTSVERGRPYGTRPWILSTARTHRLTNTLNPIGRPKQGKKN